MNYRHAYHAGNFADVLKHTALVALLSYLKKKETPFAVIDTHAGSGLYRLAGDEALRTKEAESGIVRLGDVSEGPPALLEYLALVRGMGEGIYPGSPLIAARLKRSSDRLVAIEKHPEEEEALARVLKPFPRARAIHADGYRTLPSLLPPPERRGIVLIDPPYERETEFSDLTRAVAEGLRRFATGTFVVWLPLKADAPADRLGGEMMASGAKRLVRIDFDTAPGLSRDDGPLLACALLVVNPPFGFAGEMQAVLAVLAPRLGAAADTAAEARVAILASD